MPAIIPSVAVVIAAANKEVAMKNIRSLLYISIFVVFASCASNRSVIRAEPESVPSAPVEEPSPMDLATRRVKQNLPDIHKYFALDEVADIIIMADLTEQSEDFHVVYDLVNAVPAADGSRFTVSFSISSKQSGKTRDDTLEWLIQEDKAGLLLSLDDDYQDVWTEYLDLFDQYSAKITFFVQGRLDPFCTLALSRGHDVGYHSINHLNLPKVSREVFFEETTSDINTFRDAGIPLNSFAYPYGLSESWMHEELLRYFKILRGYGVTFRVYDTAAIQRGYISSKAIDNTLYKQNTAFEAIITLMLRTVKFIGGDIVLPLTTHTITDNADWGIKPARLEYLLRMANQLQLKFYRYSDFEPL
ncbi:MAG: polysaccharide deacetylase family protein [Treponema sp.]|jgi:peptidoglycan/xylan/chitin deacetylase (PgdA/CDA1 family)|nr:polysaccharide deacetylase family protein [Treponema sp.]